MTDVLLKLVDLKKSYKDKNNKKEALKGISFEIYKKEIISLLGVNGAGKTTLSSIIASLIPPSAGDVIFEGKSIYKDIISYRRLIGFCPQIQNLDTDLNIEDNLTFCGKYYGMKKKEIAERKKFLLDAFDLESYVKSNINTLSGGYKQRFMIARTIMHCPKLIILDEPTVGLDAKLRRQLWKHILDLKDQGATILLTTHYLDEADILSDRICIIDNGELKLIGAPADLKTQWKKQNLEEVFLHLINASEEKNEN